MLFCDYDVITSSFDTITTTPQNDISKIVLSIVPNQSIVDDQSYQFLIRSLFSSQTRQSLLASKCMFICYLCSNTMRMKIKMIEKWLFEWTWQKNKHLGKSERKQMHGADSFDGRNSQNVLLSNIKCLYVRGFDLVRPSVHLWPTINSVLIVSILYRFNPNDRGGSKISLYPIKNLVW